MEVWQVIQENLQRPITAGHLIGALIVLAIMQWQTLKAIGHVSAQVGDVAAALKAPKRD
jgi:hypothetical protein